MKNMKVLALILTASGIAAWLTVFPVELGSQQESTVPIDNDDIGGVVTSATKSNASRFGYVLWDEVAEEVAADHPGIRYERVLVDALASRMVRACWCFTATCR